MEKERERIEFECDKCGKTIEGERYRCKPTNPADGGKEEEVFDLCSDCHAKQSDIAKFEVKILQNDEIELRDYCAYFELDSLFIIEHGMNPYQLISLNSNSNGELELIISNEYYYEDEEADKCELTLTANEIPKLLAKFRVNSIDNLIGLHFLTNEISPIDAAHLLSLFIISDDFDAQHLTLSFSQFNSFLAQSLAQLRTPSLSAFRPSFVTFCLKEIFGENHYDDDRNDDHDHDHDVVDRKERVKGWIEEMNDRIREISPNIQMELFEGNFEGEKEWDECAKFIVRHVDHVDHPPHSLFLQLAPFPGAFHSLLS